MLVINVVCILIFNWKWQSEELSHLSFLSPLKKQGHDDSMDTTTRILLSATTDELWIQQELHNDREVSYRGTISPPEKDKN